RRSRAGGGDGRVPQRLPAAASGRADRGRCRLAAPSAVVVGLQRVRDRGGSGRDRPVGDRPRRGNCHVAPGAGRAAGAMGASVMAGAVAGRDGVLRCPWALSAPEYRCYHDEEWGRPVRSDAGIFERLSLEAFQSGLSWLTILRKRENFRAAFGGFEPATVAGFGPDDEARLLADTGIVRNRAKIEAVIRNAPGAPAGARRNPPPGLAVRRAPGTGAGHPGGRARADAGVPGMRP